MADIKKFSTKPYFDDFTEENNFLRVLFRPGYSVQTRELNQLQSILQDQVGVLADYSIPDGTTVVGGECNFIKNIAFIKLDNTSVLSYPTELSRYEGATFVAPNGVTGIIKFIKGAEDTDPITLYVTYTAANGAAVTPADASVITITRPDFGTELVLLAPTNATGSGAGVQLSAGIFYVNKTFVRNENQLLMLNKYDTVIADSEISIGILITDSIVRPEQNTSLLDNATGSPNESAPGAHRYQITLTLVNKADIDDVSEQSFKELLRLNFGKVAAKPRTDSEYTVLEQILAKRTYDESGDYVVDDFIIDIREHLINGSNRGVYELAEGGDESKLILQLDRGRAYVRGFQVETAGDTYIPINKARTTESATNVVTQTAFGTALYVYLEPGAVSKLAVPGTKINLRETSVTGSVIGSAFIRGYSFVETRTVASVLRDVYRLDIIGVAFTTAGKSWSDIKGVDQVNGTAFASTVFDYMYDKSTSVAIYELPQDSVSSAAPQTMYHHKYFGGLTINGSGVFTLTCAAGETFSTNLNDWSIHHPTNSTSAPFRIRPAAVSVTGNTATVTISGSTTVAAGLTHVLVKIYKATPTIKSKTITTTSNAGLTPAAAGVKIMLTKTDIISVESVVSTVDGDVTARYNFDFGQRDDLYELGSISLKTGQTAPTGTLTVSYTYFAHGAGDFFGPGSYSAISADDHPVYVTSLNRSIKLSRSYDFRIDVSGGPVGGSGVIPLGSVDLSRNAFVADSVLFSDVSYYVPRMDRVVLGSDGAISTVTGKPALSPVIPHEPTDSITLYNLYIPAYTHSTNDVIVSAVQHKRFTMKDIGAIDRRVSEIEEVTLLNSLERDVQAENFKDRFKSGFIADNFSSQAGANIFDPLHKCSYDVVRREVRPRIKATNLDLTPITTSGVTTHADGVITLSYTTEVKIKQTLASETIRLQPYMAYDWVGHVTLNPSNDFWFDTQSFIDTKLDRGFFVSTEISNNAFEEEALLGGVWNFSGGIWRNNGVAANHTQKTQLANAISVAKANGQIPWNGVITSFTVTSSSSAIPFMRAKTVAFSAAGLKPGVRMYASFGGVSVDQYCKKDGSTLGGAMIVNGNGTITGTFAIPDGVFRTGAREFKLQDNPLPSGDFVSSIATSSYTAAGTLINLQSNLGGYIYIPPPPPRRDPVAQSFFIDEGDFPGGAFVKAVGAYFGPDVSPTTNIYPVECQLREMNNGYPSSDQIIATTILPASAIHGSTDGSVETVIPFTSPVFLKDKTEYCFVLISTSERITIWSSVLGQRSYKTGDTITPTGEIIAKQPSLGSAFLSQNLSTWTADQTRDVKFKLYTCKFGTTGSISLRNSIKSTEVDTTSNPYRRMLRPDALQFTSGTKDVIVDMWGHGFTVGDLITIKTSQAIPPTMAGNVLPAWIFDVAHTVSSITQHTVTFAYTAGSNASSSAAAGGNLMTTNFPIDYSYVQLTADNLVPLGSNISYAIKGKLKASYGAGVNAQSYQVSDGDIVSLGTTMVAKDSDDNGLQLDAALKSTATNISPVFMVDRTGVTTIQNIANNISYLNASTGLWQADSSTARYVQNDVTLLNPANELRVIFGANMSSSNSVNVYYKIGNVSPSEQSEWKKLPVETSLVYTDVVDEFRDQRFSSVAMGELGPFSAFSVMIEMLTSDITKVPRIKDYRALALFK